MGFQHLSRERQRELAQMGGKAALSRHRFTSEEARAAGLKGGASLSANREHMREIGRRGGTVTSSDRAHMSKIGKKGGAAPKPRS